MNQKKIDILIPNYLSDFKCIGSACEDTCCKGWRVDIDKETFQRYKKSNQIVLKPMFNRYIKRNRRSENDSAYGKIVMGVGQRCPFLDEKGLCQIQLNLGEDYLSKTCWSYPRVHNLIDNQAERCAFLSCPEVVRKVIGKPEGISFEKMNITYSPKDGVVGRLITQDVGGPRDLKMFFWDIRIMSLSILQNRTYPLDQRMVLLGMFLQNLNDLVSNKEVSQCKNLIAAFDEMLNNREFDSELSAIKFDPETQINVVLILMKIKRNIGISGERYRRCFDETVTGLAVDHDVVDVSKLDCTLFTEFFNENEYMLENYVVNEFFREVMPFGRFETVWEAYIYLCVMFSMVKIHLLGIGLHQNRIDEELVVEVIQSLSKEVGHNPVLFKQFIDLLKESGFHTLQYMALLTKYPPKN